MATSLGAELEDSLSAALEISKEVITQVASLSEDATTVLRKCNDAFDKHTSQEAKWRSDLATLRRARVNSEQQFNQVEKQLISCNAKLESEIKQHQRLQKEYEQTAASLEEKQKRLKEVEGIKEDASTNYTRVSRLNEQLESEKLELLSVVERKNQEIDRLNEEWKTMSEKLSAANATKCEAQAKLDEIENQETSFKFREKRLEQERQLMKKENEWLNEELKKRTVELVKLRKEKSSQVLQLQSQLDESNEELTNVRASLEGVKENNEEMSSKVESYMHKMKEAREQFVKMEDHYKMELGSQSKLAVLYKDVADEGKKKSEELLVAFEELQKLLKQANEGRLDLDSKLKEQEAFHSGKAKEFEERIDKLEKKLENANDLLAAARQRGAAPLTPVELSTLSPTAAATSSFLKSGMTLTQIYSQYVEVSDALQQEKDENTRLKQYLDQILKEIEEKAPVLQQQRRDYEQALHSVDQLSRRLDVALVENEESKAFTDEALKKSEHLRRENERLRNLSADLSQQVQVLLKECEEARGGVVSSEASTFPMSSTEVTSSSQVISEHLVTFRNIEELQQQNQKLLKVVRELSEEKEKKEGDGAIEQLKNQLDLSVKEIDHLKETRERQVQMVEAVIRQRDMYRVLLASTGQTPIPTSDIDTSMLVSTPLPKSLDKSQAELEETKVALKELQRHFESYKTDRTQSEQKLNERMDKLQNENTELNGSNARLGSQLEFAEEKYKILKSNCEAFKKEATAASEKAQKLQVAYSKVQLSLDSVSQELTNTKEQSNKLEVMCENLRAEKALLKESEVRLIQENKSLLEHQKSQNAVVTNLQTLQNNLERSEFEARTRLGSQVESLQRELNLLRRKLESEEKHHKCVVSTWENRVQELQSQLNVEIKTHQQAREQLLTSTKDIDAVQLRCSQAEAQLQVCEKRVEELLNRDEGTLQEADQERIKKEITEQYAVKIQEYELKLNDAEAHVKTLEEQLQQAKQHVEQFRSMSEANEQALSDLNKVSEEFKKTTETKLKTSEQEVTELKTRVSHLQSQNQTLSASKAKITRETESQTKHLRETLGRVQAELAEALRKAQASAAAEMEAKEELKEQAQLSAEAQDKYERELVLHANDVQALTLAKEKFQEQSTKFSEMEERAVTAEQKLQEYKTSWEEQKKAKSLEAKKLEARYADLVNQNSMLHSQLEKLSGQLAAGKDSSLALPVPSKEVGEIEGTGDNNKTMEELWEIIRFVRREKEIAETKCELSQSESIRYQQRCEYLESQIEDMQKNLTEQRCQSATETQTAAEHADIMAKVKKLNELAERNKILADEKDRAEQKSRLLETKVQKLEGDIRPLKDSNQSLASMKDALLAEKTALKNEIIRWTAKTNQLIEQYKNVDAEEYKRMSEEKKQFQQQISTLKSDNQRMKTQMESLKSDLSKTQGELVGLKAVSQKSTEQVESIKKEHQTQLAKVQQEVDSLKTAVTAKEEEVNEKNKTLLQVKRIARRYKTQVDEQTKEMEELKKKAEESQTPGATAGAAAPTATSTAENADVASYEEKIKQLTDQVNTSEDEVKKLKELDEQNKTLMKEKEDRNKKVLIQVREKLQQLAGNKDKLNVENEDLRKKFKSASEEKESVSQQLSEMEMRLKVLNSQFEGKITRLEKELKEAKEDKTKTEKAAEDTKKNLEENVQKQKVEVEKLQQRVQQQQAIIQKQQMKLKSFTAAASSSMTRPTLGEPSRAETTAPQGQETPTTAVVTCAPQVSLVPPTATIKPTTAPTTIKRAGPKASVRPIAVAPTQSSPTPTATVLPTVTPTPSEAVSVAGVPRVTGTAIISTASTVSTSVPTTVSVRPITSTAEVEQQQRIEGEPEVSSTEGATTDQPQPTPSTAVVSGKRQREDPEATERTTVEVVEGTSTDDEPVSKKQRTVQLDVDAEVGTSQESVVEDDVTAVEVESDEEQLEDDQRDECLEVPSNEGQQQQQEQEVEEEEEAPASPRSALYAEVVLIESDDGEDYEEGGEDGEGYFEDEEGEVGEDEEEEEGEEYMEEDTEEVGLEQDEEAEEVEEEKRHVVEVIVDDDEEEEIQEVKTTNETQQVEEEEEEQDDVVEEGAEEVEESHESLEQVEEAAGSSTARESPATVQLGVPDVEEGRLHVVQEGRPETPAVTAPFAQQTSQPRLLSARSHLAPFSFPQGQPAPGPFDEADDCMVPSTPTLFVPKRTDGFAEAISSPQINRPFSFAAPGENSMSQAGGLELGMSEEGLRVDDTQVDLMGGSDESSSDRPSFVVPSGRSRRVQVKRRQCTGCQEERTTNIQAEEVEVIEIRKPITEKRKPRPAAIKNFAKNRRGRQRGLPETSEANTQSNERLPSTGSDTRQLSMESLESEPESNSLATVPAIMVTPVSGPSQSVDVTEESAEQNVPVSRDHPESLEAEVAELLEEVEPLKEGEEVTAEQGTEGKESSVVAEERQESVVDESSQPSTSGEAPTQAAITQSSNASSQPSTTSAGTGSAPRSQDSNRPKGSVVQLRRPDTATWSTARGGYPVQRGAHMSGRVRRLRRDPIRGPGTHRGRGTQFARGRQGGVPRGGQI